MRSVPRLVSIREMDRERLREAEHQHMQNEKLEFLWAYDNRKDDHSHNNGQVMTFDRVLIIIKSSTSQKNKLI